MSYWSPIQRGQQFAQPEFHFVCRERIAKMQNKLASRIQQVGNCGVCYLVGAILTGAVSSLRKHPKASLGPIDLLVAAGKTCETWIRPQEFPHNIRRVAIGIDSDVQRRYSFCQLVERVPGPLRVWKVLEDKRRGNA